MLLDVGRRAASKVWHKNEGINSAPWRCSCSVLNGSKLVQFGGRMPKRVAGDIEMSLRRRIETGEWSESRRLPNERLLASEYGVARNTIRAAMERLSADGGLRREVGRGTFLQRSPDADLAAVTRTLIGVSPADTMAVRQIIEPKAVALAATKSNLADLNAIAAAHEKAVEAEGFEPFERCDAVFHELIFIASRNELLAALHAMLRLIRNQEQWLRIKRRSFTPGRRADYCDEHAAIVRALLHRDAEAAENAMLVHLDSVGRNLLNAP
jgi:DNA-binding FadR family transcriptional regulator